MLLMSEFEIVCETVNIYRFSPHFTKRVYDIKAAFLGFLDLGVKVVDRLLVVTLGSHGKQNLIV